MANFYSFFMVYQHHRVTHNKVEFLDTFDVGARGKLNIEKLTLDKILNRILQK